jgi:hypothetical protein
VSFLLNELSGEASYANGYFVRENAKHLVCKLEEGVFLQIDETMIMIHGEPLMRRFNEIIDRVVEAGI